MKAMHDVLGEVEIIDASEGLTVLIEHDGQTKEVLRRSVTPLPAAELRRREQAAQPEAQPTPGAWQIGYNEALVVAVGPEPCIVADCATDCAVSPERAKANAAFIVRAKKLAADNERLRALVIATATGIREVADLLAPTAPATAASLRHRADAAIEAAKEASK